MSMTGSSYKTKSAYGKALVPGHLSSANLATRSCAIGLPESIRVGSLEGCNWAYLKLQGQEVQGFCFTYSPLK